MSSFRVRYLVQFVATAAGTVLDVIVKKFVGGPTWVMGLWLIVALAMAAASELLKSIIDDLGKGGRSSSGKGTRYSGELEFFRLYDQYSFGTVIRAVVAAAAAVLACCAITLAIITMRILLMYNKGLGKGSPLDQGVIAFVSNFQTAEGTAVLFFGTIALALLLKSEFVLPVGVLIGSVVNSWAVVIPTLRDLRPGFTSQVAQSLSPLNAYLFRMPPLDLFWGCAIPFGIGLALCAAVGLCAR